MPVKVEDKEHWIQIKAEELSEELLGRGFYDNGIHLQLMLWAKAEEDYYERVPSPDGLVIGHLNN